MTTQTLTLAPEQDGYTVTDSSDWLSSELDGGLPRTRLDIIDGARLVELNWICDATEFEYLQGFYNTNKVRDAEEFYIDLIMDLATPSTHLATFVPDSFRLTRQSGFAYFVSATLEVKGTALNFGTGGDGDDGDLGNARASRVPVRPRTFVAPVPPVQRPISTRRAFPY